LIILSIYAIKCIDGRNLMGFKSNQRNMTFSDLENSSVIKKNRSLETLMNMEKTTAWDKIESILLNDYPVGYKKEGNKAYSPLLLFKCLLLQKWFRVKSDPELESKINDRNSLDKNNIDIWFRQVAFNIQRGFNIFKRRAATA